VRDGPCGIDVMMGGAITGVVDTAGKIPKSSNDCNDCGAEDVVLQKYGVRDNDVVCCDDKYDLSGTNGTADTDGDADRDNNGVR